MDSPITSINYYLSDLVGTTICVSHCRFFDTIVIIAEPLTLAIQSSDIFYPNSDYMLRLIEA
jgi:hypothetical protein